jgi:hypothetical protein
MAAYAARFRGTVAGRMTPLNAGARVRLQKLVGRRWRTVATVRARRGGGYSAPVTRRGTYRIAAAGFTGPTVVLR